MAVRGTTWSAGTCQEHQRLCRIPSLLCPPSRSHTPGVEGLVCLRNWTLWSNQKKTSASCGESRNTQREQVPPPPAGLLGSSHTWIFHRWLWSKPGLGLSHDPDQVSSGPPGSRPTVSQNLRSRLCRHRILDWRVPSIRAKNFRKTD